MLQLCGNVMMSFGVTESGAVHYGGRVTTGSHDHLEHHMMKEYIVEGAEQVLHHHDNLEEELKMCNVLKEGRDLIGSIEHKLGASSSTPDKINATATVR